MVGLGSTHNLLVGVRGPIRETWLISDRKRNPQIYHFSMQIQKGRVRTRRPGNLFFSYEVFLKLRRKSPNRHLLVRPQQKLLLGQIWALYSIQTSHLAPTREWPDLVKFCICKMVYFRLMIKLSGTVSVCLSWVRR